MSNAIILEFAGVSADDYHAVNAILGLDPVTGEGDWPAGLPHLSGCAGDDGSFLVFELWDSQESHGSFMSSRLGPALDKVGLPEPSRVEWLCSWWWAASSSCSPVGPRRTRWHRCGSADRQVATVLPVLAAHVVVDDSCFRHGDLPALVWRTR